MTTSEAPISQRSAATEPFEAGNPRWTHRETVIAIGLWLIAGLVLVGLSLWAHSAAEFPGDEGIAVLVQKIQFPPLVMFINFSSDANWPAPAGYIAVATIVALLVFRQLSAAIAAAVASFGADLANVTLNGLVARPRPHNTSIHTVANLGLHSFPSGHVTHVIALYGFLLYLTVRFEREYPKWTALLWGVRVVCLYFICFIGLSRVLEGEHWPSDVLASYLLGGLMLGIAIPLYHLLLKGFTHLRQRFQTRAQAGHSDVACMKQRMG